MTKTSELAEFIHIELQQGKTIAQIKKDVKQRGYGWSSKDISKAIHAAVQKELHQRKPLEQRFETNIESPKTNVNQVWMWAAITALIAIIAVSALALYLFR
ncbi:MAG: hypothetical protein Q8R15_00860 [Candidatus Micrarchaeota archaeon]|nr:hypothetical protein [Candidatus Micrarchaeota archaeon]